MATFISNTPAETEAIARQIAEDLVAGSVLALKGELGSGKTLFAQGLVAGLKSDAAVTSPTFTIVHEYQGWRLPVYHFDFFRLENRESAVRLGLEDYFFSDGVSVIEWADRFPELIPEQARWISFEIESERQRIITLFRGWMVKSSSRVNGVMTEKIPQRFLRTSRRYEENLALRKRSLSDLAPARMPERASRFRPRSGYNFLVMHV